MSGHVLPDQSSPTFFYEFENPYSLEVALESGRIQNLSIVYHWCEFYPEISRYSLLYY